jgi:hypothetical protein
MAAPNWGDVVSDLDVLAAIFDQAGFEITHNPDSGFSIEREGYMIRFQFELGRLTNIQVTGAHPV